MSNQKPAWAMSSNEYLNYLGVFEEDKITTICENGDDGNIDDEAYYELIKGLIGQDRALKYMKWITHGDFNL